MANGDGPTPAERSVCSKAGCEPFRRSQKGEFGGIDQDGTAIEIPPSEHHEKGLDFMWTMKLGWQLPHIIGPVVGRVDMPARVLQGAPRAARTRKWSHSSSRSTTSPAFAS